MPFLTNVIFLQALLNGFSDVAAVQEFGKSTYDNVDGKANKLSVSYTTIF